MMRNYPKSKWQIRFPFDQTIGFSVSCDVWSTALNGDALGVKLKCEGSCSRLTGKFRQRFMRNGQWSKARRKFRNDSWPSDSVDYDLWTTFWGWSNERSLRLSHIQWTQIFYYLNLTIGWFEIRKIARSGWIESVPDREYGGNDSRGRSNAPPISL